MVSFVEIAGDGVEEDEKGWEWEVGGGKGLESQDETPGKLTNQIKSIKG